MHPLLKLHQALNQKGDIIPAGFKTSFQWSKEFKVSNLKSRQILRDLLRDKVVEMSKFRIATNKRIQLIPHYRQLK